MQNKLKEEEKRLLKSGSKSTLLDRRVYSGVAFLALKIDTYILFIFKRQFSHSFYITYHLNSLKSSRDWFKLHDI